MSPNHTILSARCPKLEVATKRFLKGGGGGTPLEKWGLGLSDFECKSEKRFFNEHVEHKKSDFLSVVQRGLKYAVFWGSSKRVKNRQKSSFGAEISRTVGDKGPRKCRKSRKFGPYGCDHNFCQTPKNGRFSAFFTPPKKPLKMAKNRLFWGPRQNHHDKHVCEIANSSSHVHHNYFFSLHMCECGNSHSPKWGQKRGVFGGSKKWPFSGLFADVVKFVLSQGSLREIVLHEK